MNTSTQTAGPSQEDLKALLSEKDIKIVLDMSGSMKFRDCPNNKTRYEYMQEQVFSLAADCAEFDDDGLDIFMMHNGGVNSVSGQKAEDIPQLFASHTPKGSTPTHQALQQAFKKNPSGKGQVILCYTDGEPDDEESVVRAIVDQSKKQSTDDECTVLFVQVGYDKDASAFLDRLDNNLKDKGAKFDIVCSAKMDEVEKFPSTAHLIHHAINN